MAFTRLAAKDPDAEVYYSWDFSAWLGTGETIGTIAWPDFPAALTKSDESETAGVVQIKIAGGVAGTDYDVTCRITTNLPQIEDKTATIPCEET